MSRGMMLRAWQLALVAIGLLSLPVNAVNSRGTHKSGWLVKRPGYLNYALKSLFRGGAGQDGGEEKAQEIVPTPLETTSKENSNKRTMYNVSVCSKQGDRIYMEDEYFCSRGGDFCAVFDGHGGKAVSRYLRQNLYANLIAALPAGVNRRDDDPQSDMPTVLDFSNALAQSIEKVDQEVQRISHWSYQGSTAVCVWLHEDRRSGSSAKTILAANVGDSRAVLSRAGVAIDLTRDHKPNDPIEKARIEARGGEVVNAGGVYRINGNLALSRAIGDRSERPSVSGEPEIRSELLDETCDGFIILGSDGLWDVMGSQEAVSFVHAKLEETRNLSGEASVDESRIATLVTDEALRRGSVDNVTVVIIWLNINGE